jgi:alkanesulfonate monooxygenase SsuD/methylene tetrahydromethanopterin reductase-like flavin-dependent oxidoreductase (luciferase family)
MRVQYFVKLREVRDIRDLYSKTEAWASMGIEGVVVSDHLFTERSPTVRRQRRHDPIVLLAAVGALAPELRLALLVANLGIIPPAQLFRHFAELALLFGGERVYGGMGAGWNADEFSAVGLQFPSHRERVERLRETARAARELFDVGSADIDGKFVKFRHLPLSPSLESPPHLAIGGGSPPVIEIAAEFADHMDFDAPAAHVRMPRHARGPVLRTIDLRRRMATTWESVRSMRTHLLQRAADVGRDPLSLTTSIHISAIGIVPFRGRTWRDEWREVYAIDTTEFTTNMMHDSPFFLIGSRRAVRRKVQALADDLALSFIVVPDVPDLADVMRILP